MGVRPKLRTYIQDTWKWREFTAVLASSRVESENQNTYLGKIWSVLTPLINSLVYVLIFGFLLGTRDGMDNVVGFIVVGTFMYGFFSSSVTAAAKSINQNANLVRSLHFPRSVLPTSAVLAELLTLVPATVVMVLISQISIISTEGAGAMHPLRWVLVIPAIGMLYVFSVGVGMMLARFGARVPDILKLLPFILRLGMYASGVLFSIQHQLGPGVVRTIMEYQPVAVFLDIGRQAMLAEDSIPIDPSKWGWGIFWAVVTLAVGFVVFWNDEARYGRD